MVIKMEHGGDIYRNRIQLDYSVNTNPFGAPDSVIEALHEAVTCCEIYPDFKQEALKKAIAQYEEVEEKWILCGNGASELFLAAEHAIRPKKVLIPIPSFYGYEHAAKAEETEILYFQMDEKKDYRIEERFLAALTGEIDLLYLANPNNPTGQLISISLLERILTQCEKNEIYVVLDECFLPFLEEQDRYHSFFQNHSFPHLIRIRAFTKTFAIPGVRMGYFICTNHKLCDAVNAQLSEWNLSVFAQKAGVAAAGEQAFLKKCIPVIAKERDWLVEQLKQFDFQILPGEANFILFHASAELYEKLKEQGILIRDCSNFRGLKKGYYRIAVKTRNENEQLLFAMRETLKKQQTAIEIVQPKEIEQRSFQIISRELAQRKIVLPKEEELITKRVIHTSADFEYADTMCYSPNAVAIAKELIRKGADIVTDTNMALAGVNKKVLASYGGEAHCFMADADVAALAKERNVTRATISMEKAAQIKKPVIFAVGNAPTALIELDKMIKEHRFTPAFIIGVPVGFVNVVQAKELILKTEIPYIVNRGRKGGSNVAAAICNGILYQL